MLLLHKYITFLAAVFLMSCSQSDVKVPDKGEQPGDDQEQPEDKLIGKTLPDWEEGFLDIHAINTGRGESSLLIFPDGTSMLIDAAGSLIDPNHEIPPPPQKPNTQISPGKVIAHYAQHFLPSGKLDYMMLSHFDPDHMGSYSSSLPLDPTGHFRMSGVTEVGAMIPVGTILDRGYPDYNFPKDMSNDKKMMNYRDYIQWAQQTNQTQPEQFQPGRNDQIVLKHDAAAYSEFKVQNILANGVIWTGSGTSTRNTFPDAASLVAADAAENIFSMGLVLSYGGFDYFTAGDLQYNGRSTYTWKDIETPIASVVPEVDVMKADHHGTANCNADALLQSLKPHTVVAHVWRDVHPNPTTVGRIYAVDGDCQIFTTNLTDANRGRLAQYISQLKGTQGHIVVRVKPGGEEYMVYVLDDNNEDYTVKAVYGPYQSK